MSSVTSSGIPVAPVPFTGSEILECGKEFGPDFASRMLRHSEAVLEYCRKAASFQSAALRCASSSGSTGSGSGSPIGIGRPAGLTGTRLGAINKVASWRNNNGDISIGQGSIQSEPRRRPVPNGMCYTKLLATNVSESAVLKIGEWPTFGSLVRLSEKIFKPIAELERFRLDGDGDMVHVLAGGRKGRSFLDAVALYASTIKAQPGTLAAAVSALRPAVGPTGIFGKTRVGGLNETQRMALAGDALGVRLAKPYDHPWRFVQAMNSCHNLEDVVVYLPDGDKFSVTVVADHGVFCGFLNSLGQVMFPLFSSEVPCGILDDILHDKVWPVYTFEDQARVDRICSSVSI